MKACLALAILMSATIAHGDPNKELAKAHFKQAQAYQRVGEFAKAAEELKAAYELDPRPEMLFNIGQALRLAGSKRDALDYFKRYLDEQPNGPRSDEARRHVATLTKETSEEDARQVPAAPAEPAAILPPAPPLHIDRVETRRSPELRIAGLVSAGVGLVAIGVGVKFGLDARAVSNTINQHDGPWFTTDEQLFRDGEAANRNMAISYVVGGALVITGGVLYWLGSRTQVTLVPSSQSVTAAASGRF